jgi:hypothetical protein
MPGNKIAAPEIINTQDPPSTSLPTQVMVYAVICKEMQ